MTVLKGWLQTTAGVVVVLLLVQFLTGVLLAFYYVPSVDHAYTTVSYVEKVVSSGSWIRSLHHYGSQWLSVFLFIHVIRLFLTRAYTSNRLQWDARAFFSTRVAEGLMAGLPLVGGMARLWLLGGSDISTVTLSRFFALHVLLIPAFILTVIVWKFAASRFCWSNVWRHAIAAGLVFVALAVWAFKHPAPLGPSVAEMTADYLPRPGAQFLWIYQTLKYIPGGLGSVAGLVLPGVVLLVLVLLPWLKLRRLFVAGLLGACVVLVGVMTTASYLSDR